MSYEQSKAPIKVAIGLGLALLITVIAYSVFQQAKTTSFRSTLAQCAREYGAEDIDWVPMHGIHELYIGEKFEAASNAQEAAILCAVRKSGSVSEDKREAFDKGPATLEIWFSESMLEPDTIVFLPRSD